MKTSSSISNLSLSKSTLNPIRNLTPQSLSRILDSFHQGYLSQAALAWESIERRDDVIQGVASKRKKAISRLPWQIKTLDDSHEALLHKEALEFFYNNLSSTHATDSNLSGGFSLLVKQMLDSVGKKYAIHEIIYQHSPHHSLSNGKPAISATFKFVPLWFFENTSGSLRLIQNLLDLSQSTPLDPGSWLVTSGDGLMEASSIAYLFKHLPLRDWLIYCERNGMPGVKGITDARPGTPQWDSALQAVRDFGSEFTALMSRGTDIQPIDLTTRGDLPYPALVDRMDRALIALWRGSDLSTLSQKLASGASIQSNESNILEHDDALLIAETLHHQVDRHLIHYLFNSNHPKASIHILSPQHTSTT